jgi:DNA polymerase III, alpha subunit (gram-positive type)
VILSGGIFMIERNKGKSLLTALEDYTVVDLETTGFSAQCNHIIEVGCIKFRKEKEVIRYQSLIKSPEPIPYVIECLTGIHN